METFEPLVNLLVLMSALSIAAERLANAIKLRDPALKTVQRNDKDRERQIANRVLAVSVLLAVAVRADFFAILSHLDAPWETLGWARSPSIHSPWQLLSVIGGTVLTGISLGFGSKFWHDVLDVIYAAKDSIRRHADGRMGG